MTLSVKIQKKFSTIPEKDLQLLIENILDEYSEFDLKLLQKYFKSVDLPNEEYVNL